jgi:serine/threonine-protein kinase
MSYKRRRGMGGGRSGKTGPPDTDSSGATPADAAPPRTPTLSELFAVDASDSDDGSGGRRPGRWLVSIIVAAVFLGVGYVAAVQWVLPAGGATEDPSLVRVPELVGLTEEEAQGRLEHVGLEYTVRSGVTHHLAPEGAVLAQNPLPGQYSRPGAPVYVSLSRGPELHALPDVAGLSERQAVIVLERLGYSVVVERRTHTLEQGKAIETDPAAGTELAVPEEIRLVVSEGRPVVQVPDLVGRHVDDAAGDLARAGLELGAITYDSQALEAPGRIVGQHPPPGYSAREGERVEVRVAGDVERVNPTRDWFEREHPTG